MAEGVTVGAAAKIAVEVTKLAAETGMTVDTIIPVFNEALSGVLETMEEHTDRKEPTFPAQAQAPTVQPSGSFNAPEAVHAAFPGSTNVVAPPSAPAPSNVTPFPQQQAPAAPAGLPGAAQGGDDQVWQMLLADIQSGKFDDNWYDNRVDKKSAKSPDFKHKSYKTDPGSKYTASIWLKDAPEWAKPQLAAYNLA